MFTAARFFAAHKFHALAATSTSCQLFKWPKLLQETDERNICADACGDVTASLSRLASSTSGETDQRDWTGSMMMFMHACIPRGFGMQVLSHIQQATEVR
jgi:hypothetical protein